MEYIFACFVLIFCFLSNIVNKVNEYAQNWEWFEIEIFCLVMVWICVIGILITGRNIGLTIVTVIIGVIVLGKKL